MVDFSTFNELSIPFDDVSDIESSCNNFFKLLAHLNEKGLSRVRMSEDFKNYPILKDKTLYEYFGTINSVNFKDRLREFLANEVIKIETPLITDVEKEENKILEKQYFYRSNDTLGGLACSDVWDTLSISFNSSEEWDTPTVELEKETIKEETIEKTKINVKHSSKVEHLEIHSTFFAEIEDEFRLSITKDNIWEKRNEFFPNKIELCKEVEKQLKSLDSVIFNQAIGILRNIELGKKNLIDYSHSGESQTVKDCPKLSGCRKFTINEEKVYFDNHIKSLSNANRIYFLEKDAKIYIGYIGKHLPTKKH
ncbi:hypothetical protein CRV02_12850 [Arcobacter sp. CECT 8989]|uniref:hypothetical protein n=1 Tax=Arcobacter sp. CECT 8989 TaxID=2044509 RepID=UPI00100A506D|nr:hypothetical protein [Arcobacter sp. CECT 8989]RXJ98934.1 hypothetical protein CRV02_12850 [Arcobacter sp. CECT 8989]